MAASKTTSGGHGGLATRPPGRRPRFELALRERLLMRPPGWAGDSATFHPPSSARLIRKILWLSAAFGLFTMAIVGSKWLTSRFYEPNALDLGGIIGITLLPVVLGVPIYWLLWPATCTDGALVSTKRRFLRWRPPVDVDQLVALDYQRPKGPSELIVLYQGDDNGRPLRWWNVGGFNAEQRRALRSIGPLRTVAVDIGVAETDLADELVAATTDADCVLSASCGAFLERIGALRPLPGAPVPPSGRS